MTNEQTIEAIRLAEWIEDDMTCNGDAEIAAELRRQHAEIAECDALRADMAAILRAVAIAVRGPEVDGISWGWADLPDRVAAAMSMMSGAVELAREHAAEIERLTAQLAEPASPAPGEWIEWAGGECPIADGVRHQIKMRDGYLSSDDLEARSWIGWDHTAGENDIVAYRVLA